jgi:hypothetical protein
MNLAKGLKREGKLLPKWWWARLIKFVSASSRGGSDTYYPSTKCKAYE